MGIPQNEWFIVKHPNLKWRIWRYPYFRKPHVCCFKCQVLASSADDPSLTKAARPTGCRDMPGCPATSIGFQWGYPEKSMDLSKIPKN